MNPTDTAIASAETAVNLEPVLHAGPDLSMLGLFLQADWVVKGVMIALVLASVICWAIVIEKSVLLSRINSQVRLLAAAAVPGASVTPQGEGLTAQALRAGAREWRDGREAGESRGEYRHRIEHAMRGAILAQFRRAEPGLPFLATTGAVAPFIGLFGTVWGIMNSFAGIARSNDTSLAVVAPGIAEALFATAIGLVAAIPAVIAYNRLMVRLGRLRQEANGAASELAANLSRRPPVQGHVASRAHAAAE
ncbi:MotA/TolQ/ExbB proton channel family protein [Roseomonas marmotae]|uniref:MotA/TolQ/ExbB proton channel family protein n=1 Tax=Roseomonas marmotae TaxID=2768161 RepID=A0ABS3KCY6_9PROT|nr:MotA/TolQ/ExbB proton channel family protein [Roseomonas marmotae]MBO1075324.1 MotA/TolQ/ExbB proton channel family protein [Roseomonas marmotae]QTI78301.1 MotA/TolQ/ExbB proton channel family protein [Roseomonas marmotae]